MDRLRQLRKEKKIGVDELIKVLGLKTKSAYYKKETGMIRFSLDEAKKIADFLGINIEEIFFDTPVSEMETQKNDLLCRKMEGILMTIQRKKLLNLKSNSEENIRLEKLLKLIDEHYEQVGFIEDLKEDLVNELDMYKKLKLIKCIDDEQESLVEIFNEMNSVFSNGSFYKSKGKDVLDLSDYLKHQKNK